MKKFLLLILFFSLFDFCLGQTKLPVLVKLNTGYTKYKFYKLVLISKNDTVLIINSNKYPITTKSYLADLSLYNYYNRFEIYYSHDTINWKNDNIEFELSGDGSEIEIYIDFRLSTQSLESITIKKIFITKNIEAEQEWSGLIGDSPKYKLINNSNLTLFSSFNKFWGNTYKLVNNEWSLESIGGICGLQDDGPVFKPGDTVISKGVDFIGEDFAVQEKGKYVYIVEMSTSENFFKYFTKGLPPYKNVFDVYRLEKDFEVISDSVFYPRSKYKKKEIRGIYNLEAKTPDSIKK